MIKILGLTFINKIRYKFQICHIGKNTFMLISITIAGGPGVARDRKKKKKQVSNVSPIGPAVWPAIGA